MARPVPRRRASSEDEAPSADRYAGRSSRSRDDEPDDDRRPRRGRGELPSRGRGRDPEPEEERTTDGTPIPQTEAELEKVEDDEYEELLKHFDIEEGLSEGDEFAALWEAIEKSREPEEPRSSRRSRSREEPDEPPARGRRGRGRDEEPDDEPRGRRGRASRDDEPEEPRGRGRGRGRSSRDDEPEDEPRGRGRGRGRGRDDDEDDKGGRSRTTTRSGFSGFKKTREEHGNFDDFKLTDEEVLVKFLDDEPFAAYAEHALFRELKDGQRIWNCLQPDEDCPVCNTGHDARPIGLFNIVVIPTEGRPQLKVLKCGPALTKILETKSKLKTGPLTKEYYSMSQVEGKNNGPMVYNVDVIRERDVPDEWDGIEPLTDEELDEFDAKKNDSTFVKYPTQREMKDIARQLRDSE